MKKLIIAALLLITATLFAQPYERAVVEGNFNVEGPFIFDQVKGWQITFTDVDSADLVSGLTSDVWDWSEIVSSTTSAPSISATYTTGTANDTVLILIQGYNPLSGNYTTIDSVSFPVLSTTNGGTDEWAALSLSTNGFYPYVRVKIIQSTANNDQANNGTVEVFIFGVPVNTYDNRWYKR